MSEVGPRQIGRYEIITLLGEGGMARAYLTVNRGPGGFNKLAVLKQILPQYASDADFVAMFLDEARLAARLHHPNIVQTFDVAEHGGSYVLAMEYLEGLALSSIYRRIHPKAFPLETHLYVLTQILAGLHYAHTLCDYDGTPLGVVHRDVNPANVLVTFSGDVKLLDFGVAKAHGAFAAHTERNIKGKPAYCAPEQLWGGEPDARADVFAAGVMLWEVLAGRRFNRSKSLIEAAKTRLSGKEPLIREVCPDVHPGLAEICDRAMAWDPAQRFATAAEFRIELQAQLDKRSVSGRQVLVEKLDEAFSTERRGLRRLIETCLADKNARNSSASMTDAQPSIEEAFRSPSYANASPTPPSKSELDRAKATSAPVQVETDRRLISKPGVRLALGVAILATVLLGGLLARSFWGKAGQASQKQTVETVPVQPPHGPAPSVVPAAAPMPAAPEKRQNSPAVAIPTAGAMDSLAGSPGTRTHVWPAKPRPVRVNKKPVLGPGPVPKATARAEEPPSSVQPASALSAAQPEASSNLQPAITRRAQPNEQPNSAVQPGAHLVRPAVPARTNVDEKDPYTP